MNPIVGWGLAIVAVVAAWHVYGWQGVIMAVSVMVFWLLLQFSRSLRVMRMAGSHPKGHVGSAVMVNSRLKAGMTLMDVITLTRSLGESVSETPEVWAWTDDGNNRLTLEFERARLARWQLVRAPSSED